MSEQKETKAYPFCGEEIHAVAIKCKHRGEMHNKDEDSSPEVENVIKRTANIFGDAVSLFLTIVRLILIIVLALQKTIINQYCKFFRCLQFSFIRNTFISLALITVFCAHSHAAAFDILFKLLEIGDGVAEKIKADENKKRLAENLNFNETTRNNFMRQLISDETILEKRVYQTRQFKLQDKAKIEEVFQGTLLTMGFSNVSLYDGKGFALGSTYTLRWYLREDNKDIIIRVQITDNDELKLRPDERGIYSPSLKSRVSRSTYSDFWNAISRVSFLENLEISAEEL